MAETYTPDRGLLIRYGIETCQCCGSLPYLHHRDARCYTTEEIHHRLRSYQRTGRFPGQDEGCEPEEAREP